MHSSRRSHLDIALRLLRYLKSSPRKAISILKNNSNEVFGFVDANWAKCLSTRRSETSYCVYFGKKLLFLGKVKTKKQFPGALQNMSIAHQVHSHVK